MHRKVFVMMKRSIRPFAIAALAALSLGGCRGASPSTPATEPRPAHPAGHAHAAGQAADEQRRPTLFDHRELQAVQDLSGLETGTHVVEFTAYAPKREAWTPEREQRVREGIRAAQAGTRLPALTRVSFAPVEARPDQRRVRVELELPAAGSWVVLLTGELQPVQAAPFVAEDYDVLQPETLRAAGDFAHLYPNVLLRTVGPCNHVSRVDLLLDEGQTLRTLRLTFSESLEAAPPGSGRLRARGEQGEAPVGLSPVGPRVRGKVAEFDVPALPLSRGVLALGLERRWNLAGGFRQGLSCAPAEASVEVGYYAGEQMALEQLHAPLGQALALAFEEPKS